MSAHSVRARVFTDRTVRTWQFIAVATALYFGSAAPAAADELPLVQIPTDAAAAVETITAEVAPDVAPIVAEVTAPQPEAAATAPNSPPATAVSATEPSQESQYHEPEPQYQAPSTTDVEPASAASGAPDAAVSEDNAAPTAEPDADPAATTTAATVDEPAAAATGAPDTWVWNWTWNCDPASAPPAELPADASAPTWVWNWNWNCDARPDAGGNSSQYQGGGPQYQPENTNVSIRIGSPGDNGPVEQTIAAAAAAVATSVSSVAQTVVSSALADVGTTTPARAYTAPPCSSSRPCRPSSSRARSSLRSSCRSCRSHRFRSRCFRRSRSRSPRSSVCRWRRRSPRRWRRRSTPWESKWPQPGTVVLRRPHRARARQARVSRSTLREHGAARPGARARESSPLHRPRCNRMGRGRRPVPQPVRAFRPRPRLPLPNAPALGGGPDELERERRPRRLRSPARRIFLVPIPGRTTSAGVSRPSTSPSARGSARKPG